MKKILFISAAILLYLTACSSVSVTTDYDGSQDFSKYKTYRWATQKEINANDALAKAPLIKKRVIASVNKSLGAKGFELIDNGTPDFVVHVHAGVKEKMQVHNTGYRGGWYDPWWGPYGGDTHVSYYEEGSLVVDIIDWKEKELSWRGIGTGVVKNYSDQQEHQEALDEIVAKILAGFPPKGK